MPTLDFRLYHRPKPGQVLDPIEKAKLERKIKIIDRVMREFGHDQGYESYLDTMNKMVASDFGKFIKFLRRVEELEAKADLRIEKSKRG